MGAYHFPPYAVTPEKPDGSGLLSRLLVQLNRIQADYRFVMVPTSSPRRYRDFGEGRFDLIFFEAPNWGWQGSAFEMIDMQLQDAEVFVARAQAGRTSDYFDSLQGKRLALLHGYHYAFADFNADPDFLAANYQAELTHSIDSNLLMVLHGRADVALVTRSYLQHFLVRNPQLAGAFLISERVDQAYHHQALLHPESPIRPQRLAELLRRLRENGGQQALFEPFGIKVVHIRDH